MKSERRNPFLTVDIVIYAPQKGIVLIERKNPPFGFALPGGFVDYGESVPNAAVREAKEETSLDVTLLALLGVYSDPQRDPRMHTASAAYIACAKDPETLCAADDAKTAAFFALDSLPNLVFDHAEIVKHFKQVLNKERSVVALDGNMSQCLELGEK